MIGNRMKTGQLMAGIMALFGAVGAVLGGGQGMLVALAIAAAMNVWAYWSSDTMVLRLYNAREVDEHSAPQFYDFVKDLSRQAGLPMPRVYVIDEAQPNAFATGRNPEHAADAHPATAQMMIVNPLSAGALAGLFSTHPPVEERVRRLFALAV